MIHQIQEFLATSPHTKELAGISIGVCLILGLIGGLWMLGIMSRHDSENIRQALLIPFYLVFWGFLNREDANTKKPLILMLISLVGFCLLVWLLPRQHSPRSTNQPVTSGAPFAWLAVTNGETRDQLTHALGLPTEQSGSGTDVWRKGNSSLRVSYDESGRATNVWREGGALTFIIGVTNVTVEFKKIDRR